MNLYIVRHGETDWNRKKLLQGQTDIELNDYGRELAIKTKKAFENIKFDKIYSSPLKRAYETAQILTESEDIIVCEELKEISFGIGEGVPSAELGDTFTNFFFKPENYVPLKNAESLEQVCERTKKFLEEYILEDQTSKNVLIAGHGAVNKAIMRNLLGFPIKDFWKGEFQKNCCVNKFIIDKGIITLEYEAKIFYDEDSAY